MRFESQIVVGLLAAAAWSLGFATDVCGQNLRQELSDEEHWKGESFVAENHPRFGTKLARSIGVQVSVDPKEYDEKKTIGLHIRETAHGGVAISYPRVVEGSSIPIEGRMYRIGSVTKATASKPSAAAFTRAPDLELEQGMSQKYDTSFLPIGCRFRRRGCDISVNAEKVDSPATTPVAPHIVFKVIHSKIWRGPETVDVTKEQLEQKLSIGDSFRYGDRALRIRNIVLPDESRKIIGWVEVFQNDERVELRKGEAIAPAAGAEP